LIDIVKAYQEIKGSLKYFEINERCLKGSFKIHIKNHCWLNYPRFRSV
jgi:hypothetical protein